MDIGKTRWSPLSIYRAQVRNHWVNVSVYTNAYVYGTKQNSITDETFFYNYDFEILLNKNFILYDIID